MKLQSLDKAISSKEFSSVYLFFGEETGLRDEYVGEIKKGFKNIVNAESIEQVAEDTKFNAIFGGSKLYVFEDSKLFAKKATPDSVLVKVLLRFMKQSKNTLLFIESKVDTKLSQFQALGEDSVMEFKVLQQNQLVTMTQEIFKSADKKITKDLANYLVDECDYSYSNIVNEVDKLISYIDKKTVTLEDIKAVTTRSTSTVVFDLVSYIVQQRYDRALDMYESLVLRKESPLGVLTLIYRQLRLLYQIKLLKKQGYGDHEIADACDSRPFIIQKNKNLCSFDTNKLLKLMVKCDECDYQIKSGQLKDTLAVKILILYSSMSLTDMEAVLDSKVSNM